MYFFNAELGYINIILSTDLRAGVYEAGSGNFVFVQPKEAVIGFLYIVLGVRCSVVQLVKDRFLRGSTLLIHPQPPYLKIEYF